MFLILVTFLIDKALLLQGEIWCWSLLGLKGLILICNHKYCANIETHLAKNIPQITKTYQDFWKLQLITVISFAIEKVTPQDVEDQINLIPVNKSYWLYS